jgi:hypothetical protein
MVGEAIANGLTGLFRVAVVGVIAILVLVVLGVKALFFKKRTEIVSKTLIVPEIRFKTDGKKIDTLYVYRKPK